MKRVSITEAKNRLNSLLDYVRNGETVLIEDRGVPIAQLAPLNGSGADTDEAKLEQVKALARGGRAIDPVEPLRREAVRAARAYGLPVADACQLAAAITATEGDPRSLPFVTLDERLADAARREGFAVTVPA